MRSAFENNRDILFALPLYVENIPGIMLEFLETLPPKAAQGTRVSFLIQGGFPEASQGRCCEDFLKTLPEKLGCAYGGTLIHGDMFGVGLLGKRLGEKMVQPFVEIGRCFAEQGCFEESAFARFACPEYLPEKQRKKLEKSGNHVQKWFMRLVARRLGCRDALDARPYDCRP